MPGQSMRVQGLGLSGDIGTHLMCAQLTKDVTETGHYLISYLM